MSTLLGILRGSLIALSFFASFVPIISAQTVAETQPDRVEKEENCPILKPYAELDKFGNSISRKLCTKRREPDGLRMPSHLVPQRRSAGLRLHFQT
jgi:hypothetical protein